MNSEPELEDTEPTAYVLPRYLRFARTLALVSGAAVGIAAGASVVSSIGCQPTCLSCTGAPGVQVQPPPDASADLAGDETAASPDAGGTGGGPRPAPLLPPAWIG